jgi:hypothetical protein
MEVVKTEGIESVERELKRELRKWKLLQGKVAAVNRKSKIV